MLRRLLPLLAVLVAAAPLVLVPAPAGAVAGGQEADPGEWPWQVVLLVDDGVWCGGSLLAADVVLTAAHCTEETTPGMFEVVAGTVDLADRASGQRRDVAEIDQHADYDPGELVNDLSLLRLEAPFDLGSDVAVVELAGVEESAALTEEGDDAVVTGFGATGETDEPSDRLLEAEIITYGDARCADLYEEEGDDVVGASQVCAGVDRGHIDACYGDSGGPLVVPRDAERSSWLQVGIVSWGAGCGAPLRPTVYTEVAAFTEWLTERGVGPPGAAVFEGEGAAVPARGSRGKAATYPLAVEVDDFEGDLTGVSVRLVGLNHGRPEDLDIWLVSPEGTVVTLLSDVGGADPVDIESVLVIDGATPASGIELEPQIAPTNREADRQRRSGSGDTALEDFVGEDPNGEWQLLVADDRDGDRGNLDSWKLILR